MRVRLSPAGNKVRDVVLDNLQAYAENRYNRAKAEMYKDFNEHPTEYGKGSKIKIGGTAEELRTKYDAKIDTLLYWARYVELVNHLKENK